MSSRKKKTADGRTQAQAEIDAELVESSSCAALMRQSKKGSPASMRPLSRRRFRRCRTDAHAKAESETE